MATQADQTADLGALDADTREVVDAATQRVLNQALQKRLKEEAARESRRMDVEQRVWRGVLMFIALGVVLAVGMLMALRHA